MSEQQIIVYGGQPLRGTITVSGSKNAALPIILASLLTENECRLEDVPRLLDVETASQLISSLGASVRWDGANTLILKTKAIQNWEAPYEYVRKMRASVLTMGPLLARCGRAVVSLPGGCAIGSRPINLHLKGFEAMGAKVEMSGGLIKAKAKKLKGARIYLDFPSVGATENLIMAASLAEGQTIIENAAEEPEIVDLANFLNSMGAIIKGAGTPLIKIEGVAKLHGASHTIIPDRIEAGSYMIAAALTRGNLIIKNCISEHLTPLIAKLKEMGVNVWEEEGKLRVSAESTLKAVDIKTLPYPGFPTDLQAQLTTLCSVAQGTSVITETVFENRFMHVDELKRMGANIKIEGRSAIIQGVKGLSGALVRATDLRAGMALVMAGLATEGETTITHVEHIDRGYEDLISKLQGAGACIQRKTSDHSEGFSGAGILQNMAAGPALG